VGFTFTARRTARPSVAPPLAARPMLGVQAPQTSDLPTVNTLTGLTFGLAGMYKSIVGSTGAYISWSTIQSEMDTHAANGAKAIQITLQIQSTESGFDPTNAPAYNTPAVIAGTHDGFLVSFFQNLAIWMAAHPTIEVQVRVFHEMDGNWYPWGANNGDGNNGNTASSLLDAWMHVWNIKLSWCPMAQMVWCPDRYSTSTNSVLLDACYPGDTNVNYTGVDAYNWGPSTLGPRGWQTPSQIFSQTKTWLDAKAPPSIICEVGCPFAPAGSFADGTGDKDAWIASLRTYLNGWTKLAGFTWEQNKNKDNVRINELRHVDNFHFPTNGYGADTVGSYTDHSAVAFGTAFAGYGG
jgi:hypothetical protein